MLDTQMIGIIELAITDAFNKQNMIDTIYWITETDLEIKNLIDLGVGYFIGILTNMAIQKIAQKRFTESFQRSTNKIFANRKKEDFQDFQEKIEKNDTKKIKKIYLRSTVTKKEEDQVRDIIKNWIPKFRKKIMYEITQSKVKIMYEITQSKVNWSTKWK